MSTRALFRTSGAALLLGSLFNLLWTLMNAVVLPLVDPNPYGSLLFLLTSLLLLFGSIAIITGLAGMYAYLVYRSPKVDTWVRWLGLAGSSLIFLGVLVAGVGFGLISTTVIPWLTTHAPNLITGEFPPLLYVFLAIAVLLVVIGNIPLGVALVLTRILPRWPGLLLILSGLAGLLYIAPLPPDVKNIVAIISAVAFFIGLGWLGFVLWSEKQAEEIQAPATTTELP